MSTSTHPFAGPDRPFSADEDAICRGVYGNRVFDRTLHMCRTCGTAIALGHSVRVRQDIAGHPQCVDCRLDLNTGQARSIPAKAAGVAQPDNSEYKVFKPNPPELSRSISMTVRPAIKPIAFPGSGGGDDEATPKVRRQLRPLGDLVFRRNPDRSVDVTALWCGDPPIERSALRLWRRQPLSISPGRELS